jgi:hypothetical protein
MPGILPIAERGPKRAQAQAQAAAMSDAQADGSAKTRAEEAENKVSASENARRERRFTLAMLLAIAALTVLCYSSVLFDYFVGDDYVHLTWLKQAAVDPQLIWKNFYSSWLDGVTTKFYRPLISVFMVSDYLLWRTNGLGFHITNLVFHLLSALGLFGIVGQLRKATTTGSSAEQERSAIDLWALGAAALFALYPLHPEAVSWITGRVDAIVTAFSLISLWCYMRWRNGAAWAMAVSCAGTLVLALLSKEMAVTLPAVFLAFEAVRWLSKGLSLKELWRGLRCTMPFWLIVGGYFVVRRLALGTFVGGYDDSLFFIADAKHFVLSWAHALRMVLMPINGELITSHSVLTRAWQFSILVVGALSILTAVLDKSSRLRLAFIFTWFVFALLPVYKIFAIADDLQGSRLAYMATAPLCAALMLLLSEPGKMQGPGRVLSRLKAVTSIFFLILAGGLLFLNNLPWMLSGIESNRIRDGLEDLYERLPGDPEVLLIGLPDTTSGAYTCRNALPGMVQTPQFSRDVQHVLQINPFEPILPFGFLKQSIAANKSSVTVYRWDTEKGAFEAQPVAEVKMQGEIELEAARATHPPINGMRGQLYDVIVPSLPCWALEFVRVDLTTATPELLSADLFYANTADSQFQWKRRSHAQDSAATTHHVLVFPLRGLPDWSLGGRAVKFCLSLPEKSQVKIEAVHAIPRQDIMPSLSFANSGYHGSKGYLHLGGKEPEQSVSVDFSGIAGAVGARAEITRANLLFEEQNCTGESKVQGMMLDFSPQGQLTLSKKQFPTPGIYELRAWAKNSLGESQGVCSDHIVIAVDPE